jgi:hypothetical protein
MAKRQTSAPCAACGVLTPSHKLSRVVIEGRALALCRTHASIVAEQMPRTFEQLRRLFVEPAPPSGAPARRSLISRRAAEDRREFPPRPEGRRMGSGRRRDDEAA